MLAFSELSGHGGNPFVVRIAERIDSDTGAEINVFFSVFILYEGSFAGSELNGKTRIRVGDIFLICLPDIHFETFFPVIRRRAYPPQPWSPRPRRSRLRSKWRGGLFRP